jgi:hypothetical protein
VYIHVSPDRRGRLRRGQRRVTAHQDTRSSDARVPARERACVLRPGPHGFARRGPGRLSAARSRDRAGSPSTPHARQRRLILHAQRRLFGPVGGAVGRLACGRPLRGGQQMQGRWRR